MNQETIVDLLKTLARQLEVENNQRLWVEKQKEWLKTWTGFRMETESRLMRPQYWI